MVAFARTPDDTYRMHRDGSPVVAVHQVLRTDVCRPITHVLREMKPGSLFLGEQVPAVNTYLRAEHTLTRETLFPYPNTLRDECSSDRLSLLIREILEGSSSLESIEADLPVTYCVGAGIIDEVHIETTPERYDHYRSIMGERLVFHERHPHPDRPRLYWPKPGFRHGAVIEPSRETQGIRTLNA